MPQTQQVSPVALSPIREGVGISPIQVPDLFVEEDDQVALDTISPKAFKLLTFLRSSIAPSSSMTFTDLGYDTSRRVRANLFFNVLLLSQRGFIGATQAGKDIVLTPGPNF